MIFNIKTLLFLISYCVLFTHTFANASKLHKANDYAPTASFTASTVCQGNATVFTNNSTTQAGSIIASIWDFGDGEGSSVANPTHTYASSGSYTVHLTVIDTQGEADNFSMLINVYPAGNLNFITNATNYCQGSQVSFTNLSNIVSGSFSSYSWDFGDGAISSNQNPTHIYAAAGVYQVMLQTLSNNGCQATLIQQVEIYPEAVPSFIANDACHSDNVLFVNTSQLFDQVVTYTWDFGDGSTSNAAAPQHDYLIAGDYSVQLEITTLQGCSSQTSQQLTIHPRPVTNFTVNQFCFGNATTFTNLSSIASGTLNYQWSFGDGSTGISVDSDHVYQSTGVMEVTLNAISDNNCSTSSTQFITIYPSPIANFTASNHCEGELLDVENSTNDLPGGLTFTWNFGDGSGSNNREPMYTYAAPGNYQIQLQVESAQGCTDEIIVPIIVHNSPQAIINIQNHCEGNILPLNNASIDVGASPLYNWTFGDGTTSQVASPSKEYQQFGNYDIALRITTTEGCTDETSQTVQVNPLPQISFSTQPVCEQNQTVFQVNASIPYGSLSFDWTFGDGTLSTDPFPHHTYTSPGSYLVEVEVTSNNGCSVTQQAVAVVNPKPQAQFTVQNHCEGLVCPLINQSNIATGQFSQLWNLGDGNSTQDLTPIHTYEHTGQYDINLIVTSDQGCTAEAIQTVRVHSVPNVAFTVNSVCEEQISSFSNNSTVDTGVLTYAWDFGDGSFSSIQNPTHLFATPGQYVVTLTAATPAGCTAASTVLATQNPKPNVNFNLQDHCEGEVLPIENLSAISSGSLTFLWNFSDGSNATTQAPVHIYALPGLYLVNVKATSSAGCQDELTKYVRVNPKPNVDFTVENACQDELVTFLNASKVSQGTLTHQWAFGDGNLTQQINPSRKFQTYGTFQVSLTATASLGQCQSTIVKSLEIYQRPLADFQVADNCIDSTFTFDNQTLYFGTDVAYNWDFGNGQQSQLFNPEISFTAAQTYAIRLIATSDNGCSSSVEKSLKVFAKPTVNFFAANVCLGQPVEFSNFSSLPNGEMEYNWLLGDGNETTESSPSHVYTQAGDYAVVLHVNSENGCQNNFQRNITVYPPPIVNFSASPVCNGVPVNFTNQSTVAVGNISEFLWDFGDQSNSVIENPAHEFLNDGAYLVTLSARTDQGCSASHAKTFTVYPLPLASFTVTDVCDGETVNFQNLSTVESGGLNFEWNLDDGNTSANLQPQHVYQNFGVYNVRLIAISDEGCRDSVSRAVAVFRKPAINAGQDQVISKGYATQLSASGATDYWWEPIEGLSNSAIANPEARPLSSMTYIVYGKDSRGCENSDTVRVEVTDEFKIAATNVLTPDGNGKNDTWVIENIETYGDAFVRIYDRWGKLVYEKEAYQNDWRGDANGNVLPDGTYYYYISFRDSDRVYKGAITLIRN